MFALTPCDRGCAIASNGKASQTKHENGKSICSRTNSRGRNRRGFACSKATADSKRTT